MTSDVLCAHLLLCLIGIACLPERLHIYLWMVLQSVEASWSVFIVGQAINFGLIPVPLRICFAMVLTFIFNIILALVDAKAEAGETGEEHAAFKKAILNATMWK